MSSYKVIVSGQMREVRTNKFSTSTWRAAGYTNGAYFEGVGLTEASAVRSWRDRANHKLPSASRLPSKH
jgi:hypothetical protein